jgi:hypothetical protein
MRCCEASIRSVGFPPESGAPPRRARAIPVLFETA